MKFLQIDLGAWSPWGKFVRQRREIYELLQAEIDERPRVGERRKGMREFEDKRANPKKQGDDILSLMLSARDEEGEPMNDDQLKESLIHLLIVGHETTATALTWAFYWLEKSPEAKEKLLQEIDSLGENPDPIKLSQAPYLTAFCQETLRLYPISANSFARIANQDIEIMGRKFEAGTSFIINIYATHHREDLYPNSKQFKPERFLERQYSRYEFLPFGGGARLCLGYALNTWTKLILYSEFCFLFPVACSRIDSCQFNFVYLLSNARNEISPSCDRC
ncbi:MAG: cytochrome P450 [Xenococcus sp. MO_188.B8]|nr:cytochrome P450 [Xenococcus sp. MO_188.B8]